MLIADFIKASPSTVERVATTTDPKHKKKIKKGIPLSSVQNMLVPGRQICDC